MDTKYYKITKENAIKAFVNYKETEYTKDQPLIYLYTGTCKFADLCFITTSNKIIYLTSKVYVDSDIELFELIETNRKELADISAKNLWENFYQGLIGIRLPIFDTLDIPTKI